MFEDKTMCNLTIVGLGISVIYLLAKSRADKEFASAEKINLFKVCMELATDNVVLQKRIDELESKIRA